MGSGDPGAQLLLFAQSILLGLGAAAVYDLLRPFRHRRAGAVLDLTYTAALALTVFAFLLRRGEGQLRGFTVIGGLGGACLYASAFSALLRPVWDFWADTLRLALRAAAFPVRAAIAWVKKMALRGKNLFYFARKCYTIRKIGYKGHFHKGGGRRGKEHTAKKAAPAGQRPHGETYSRAASGGHGLAAVHPAK